MTKPIDTLMKKEMSRKEFLVTLAFGTASILGFSTIIHLLTGKSFTNHIQVRSGYGGGDYGN